MGNFDDFFVRATGIGTGPHPWQVRLAEGLECAHRLIRIPTGFGKTVGVLTAWLWHRVERNDDGWPRRLVWCLPMRVLVDQTEAEVREALRRLDSLWDGEADHEGKVGVHLLMGGADCGDWHLFPEHCAVLIGTQDMLLSRALNRGYGAPRARWPMEFGLLNHDCLWVMDEVQLMGVGLATSGQLHAFRQQDSEKSYRPCVTWWMSATLQRTWLRASPETQGSADSISQTDIPEPARIGHLWDDVTKAVRLVEATGSEAVAHVVAEAHVEGGHGADGPTLVVFNTVDKAVAVHAALRRNTALGGVDIRLIHSRFRGYERVPWRGEFLNRAACAAGTNRIIVATQVIEAGVDLSAAVLVTEIAPWASLVQRFGRAARWGGRADVIVVDPQPDTGKKAAPYAKSEIDSVRQALGLISDVSPLSLERFEEAHPELLQDLYPYAPRHLLLRHEIEELFDTTPDLSGADVDISRFIRDGDERDVHVFWDAILKDSSPGAKVRPAREALCAVPFLKARDWLCGKETGKKKAPRLKKGMRAWVWDWLDGTWRGAERRDLYPGQTVLVASDCGGYSMDTGWSPESTKDIAPVPAPSVSPDELADASEDDEALSAYPWQTIGFHGQCVGRLVTDIAGNLLPARTELLSLAGRWHDAGKAHEVFQNSIVGHARPSRRDLAKAPGAAWLPRAKLYPDSDGSRRAGFRHELASTLAMFAVLARHRPDHPALLGSCRGLLEAAGMPPEDRELSAQPPSPLEQEILDMDLDDFNLAAYLVCTHHGKVRVAWHASAADQRAADAGLRIRGVRDGEALPAVHLATSEGTFVELPASLLDLAPAAVGLSPRTGPGWTERVLGLLRRHGPFALAWLEALLRAADQRASRLTLADPRLELHNPAHGLEASDSRLAAAARGGEASSSLAPDSGERGGEHGLRGRTGEPGDAGSGTRPPADATRHIQTTLGILSYGELAPHLARRVQSLEEAIEAGEFDARRLDERLIAELHERICSDLTPTMAGWRRYDVRVGTHTAPARHIGGHRRCEAIR
ncbi:MAG TPA: helicase-related protein [Candidatus Margulisiibacteriota bacterium]|nr:helicase-related protein [Candidatus Margulisiibacteriota bacterium]